MCIMTSHHKRDAASLKVLGSPLFNALVSSSVLVVGAGGIGCELLKNLVLSGFRDIVVVDLDTIDVSNLNRQFLFQCQHVGLSKAKVARETVLKFNPHVSIRAYHEDIKNKELFGVDFFHGFKVVLNALDNLSARIHVNRMCLASNVPLVESGTAGYLGQTTVIRKGLTECFECQPKPTPKNFPVCTIRNTPSQPIHCIVWAKYLFAQLFGEESEDNNISPNISDPEAVDNDASATAVASDVQSLRSWATDRNFDASSIRRKLFFDDVIMLLKMDKLWEKRTPPIPIDDALINDDDMKSTTIETPKNNDTNMLMLKDQHTWSIRECVQVFEETLLKLANRVNRALESNKNATLEWDKDDAEALDFVVASSNLRSRVFNIPLKSPYEVKSIAGNIIPAIATTNAIVAGLIVLEAIRLLGGNGDRCKATFLRTKPNQRGKLFVDTRLCEPNPKCYVCKKHAALVVRINTQIMSMGVFEEMVLKGALAMAEPDLLEGTRLLLCGDDDDPTVRSKMMHEVGLRHDVFLHADDQLQELSVIIRLIHSNELSSNEFELLGNVPSAPIATFGSEVAPMAEKDDESDIEVVPEESPLLKRKRISSQDDISDDVIMVDLPNSDVSHAVKRRKTKE